MSDDLDLRDEEEKEPGEATATLSDDDLPEPEDGMPPVEEAEEGVYGDEDDEEENDLDVDPELIEASY